jgi:hypothetical protein
VVDQVVDTVVEKVELEVELEDIELLVMDQHLYKDQH